MSDLNVWGKTYNRALARGDDHGYAAYLADKAQARLEKKLGRKQVTDEAKTPGPFRLGQHGIGHENAIVDEKRKGWVLLFAYGSTGADLCKADERELVDLLNKGTHFDGMLAALKVAVEVMLQDDWDDTDHPSDDPHFDAYERVAMAISNAEERNDG